jgi:hypothetical protein
MSLTLGSFVLLEVLPLLLEGLLLDSCVTTVKGGVA